MQTEDIVNGEQKVYCIKLYDDEQTNQEQSKNKSKFEDMAKARIIEQIAESNIKAIFITPYIVEDRLPIIQTVKKADLEFILNFYTQHVNDTWYAELDKNVEKLEQSNMLYNPPVTQRMKKVRGASISPQEVTLTNSQKELIGCFLDK